jgi:poly(3-hydroxybutyrate) depolymerase
VGLAAATMAGSPGRADDDGRTGTTGTIQVTTSTGRRGAYYLPQNSESRALPLLVMLHGTGGTGSSMVVRVRDMAERQKFFAVAPDSVSVAGVWLVDHGIGGATEDHRHVVSCVHELQALRGVRVERGRVLVAGFSVGGGAASYLASREDVFTAFAVLHGHVALDALGPRRVRGWLSTGDRDRQRPPEAMRRLADHLHSREGFTEIETRIFRGGHALGDEELTALVAWWLGR